MNDLPQAAGEICSIFERMGCPYAIMGGLAARMYGIPRATYDIDFTVAVDRARLPEFYSIVEENGYTVPEPFLRGWIDEVGGLPLVKVRLYLKDKNVDVDVFLAECEFQNELLARRRWEKSEDVTGWFVSPEDLILLKLMANRLRDLSDVQDVLFIRASLTRDTCGIGQIDSEFSMN